MILKKNSVLIDLGALKFPFCGLETVSDSYARAVIENAPDDFRITFLVPPKDINRYGSKVDYESLGFFRKNNLAYLCTRYKVWHSIHQNALYSPVHGDKFILTIHDLNFLKEEKSEEQVVKLKKIQEKINKASYVTFISKFTERICRENLDFNPKIKTKVIYNGVFFNGINDTQVPGFLKEDEKFLFTIGQIREKKNFAVLVDMIKYLDKLKLIIAGGESNSEYAKYIRTRIKEEGLESRVFLVGSVSENEKSYLYQNCEAFVFPSLAEGFGLPVLEAMNYGKPVFCSNLTSLPEIGGKYAYYWENFKAEYMASFFKTGMEDFKTSEKLKQEQLKKYAQSFSWKRNVESYFEIYRELLNL